MLSNGLWRRVLGEKYRYKCFYFDILVVRRLSLGVCCIIHIQPSTYMERQPFTYARPPHYYWLIELIYFNIREPEKWNCPSVRNCPTEYLKWIKTINHMKARNWNILDRHSFKIWPNKACIGVFFFKSRFAQAKYFSTSFYTFIHTHIHATLHPYWCCQIVFTKSLPNFVLLIIQFIYTII